MKTLRQIYESLRFALQSVIVNKMRTLLSLLGITIGIFAIISVYTVIDTMESKIRESVDKLGSNIMYVGKWPWMPEEGQEYEWWRYMSRPVVSTSELDEVRSMLPNAKALALAVYLSETVQNGKRSKSDVQLIAATEDFNQMQQMDIEKGRYFSTFEMSQGARVAIIGASIAEDLFGFDQEPVGKTIKVEQQKVTVIGVLEKQGDNAFGSSFDDTVFIPYTLARSYINLAWFDKDLIIRGPDNVSPAEFKAEVESVMRRIRRLSPNTEPNFAINEVSGMLRQLDGIFSTINLVGGIIGIFSILVGGFGVANIMFVSVRERTNQIGIQKALGARPYVILLQFTFEAILLSIVGGAIGLLFIWIGALVSTYAFDFAIVLTMKNIIIGLGISSVIGAVSGIFPAYSAATMDPVAAISKS